MYPSPLLSGQSLLIFPGVLVGVREGSPRSTRSSVLESRGLDLMLELSQVAG